MAYACNTCSKKDCVSSPRVTFNCEVSDGTGTLSITTFTEDLEKLFRMTALDIFRIKHSDDQEAFKGIQELLRTSHVLIEVGPKTTLSRNNVLQWILKQVVLEDEPDDAQIEDETARELGNHAFAKLKSVDVAESSTTTTPKNVATEQKIVPDAAPINAATAVHTNVTDPASHTAVPNCKSHCCTK